ncbi:hypothetical protein VTO73DRAFT_8630 [Trametes versicolor]
MPRDGPYQCYGSVITAYSRDFASPTISAFALGLVAEPSAAIRNDRPDRQYDSPPALPAMCSRCTHCGQLIRRQHVSARGVPAPCSPRFSSERSEM